MSITVHCSRCGFRSAGHADAAAAATAHNDHACLCAICGEYGKGKEEELDGKLIHVCNRCNSEHPRIGGYSFESAPVTGKVSEGARRALGWSHRGGRG